MDIQIRKIAMKEVDKYLAFLHEVKAMMEQMMKVEKETTTIHLKAI